MGKLPPKSLIGPILETRNVKHPRPEDNSTPELGIAVLVPWTDPRTGERLAVVNISCGNVPFASLFTDIDHKAAVDRELSLARWVANLGYDPVRDLLYRVEVPGDNGE